MSIKSEIFLNSLIGTNYDKNKYFLETYDINENNIQKELMEEIKIENELNKIKKSNTQSKIEAFCLDCKTNVNLSETPNCNSHNIKFLKDLSKDINIELIENNFKIIVENYENMLNYMIKKIKNFITRNENQILLAKNLIEAYKTNIDNLNYQIILNTKNILNFNDINDINYKLLIQNNLIFDFEYNILKEFPISNYLKETLSIGKIQKNLEIKIDSKEPIDCVLLFPNRNKIIFNTINKIFLLNTKIYKIEDEIESESKILFLNLMDDKETILISHENSIEELIIENDKLKLKDFLSTNVHIHQPGVIVNYRDEIAWTNGVNIGFIGNKYYNIMESSGELAYDYNSGGYKAIIVNLLQHKNDLLFTFYFCGYNHHMEGYEYIQLGSYNRKSNYDQVLILERLKYKSMVEPQTDFKIHCLKNDDIIIFGLKNILIIDIFNWKKKVEIPIENKIIMNSYYLNDSNYLLFFNYYEKTDDDNDDFVNKIFKTKKEEKQSDLAIMKINEENNEFIYEDFVNFDDKKIFYNFSGNNEKYGLNQKIITTSENIIKFYSFIDVKKSIEMKNNKN